MLASLVFVLAAAACSGESGDGATADTSPTTVAVDPADSVDSTEGADTTDQTANGSGEIWDDPRGDIFADFQASFDRAHPFQPLDAFCLPHDAATDRQATEPGIEADSIQVHQIRSELENLVDIGFGGDVGDPTLAFDTFVKVINEECGGIRGRVVEITHTDYDPLSLDIEQARIAACVSATEDHDAAFVMGSTGLEGAATLCIAEEHNTPYIGTIGLPTDFIERGAGKLVSFDFVQEDSLRFMVERVDSTGDLDGKTIAVVSADAPGQPESVQVGLIDTLESSGADLAIHDTIGCGGTQSCTVGVAESVGNLKDAGVDVVFSALNVLSLPGYIAEMVAQGFTPGDVQFYNSAFNAQSNDVVTSKIADFGGEAASALYDGAVIVDSAATSNFRSDDDWPVPAFNQLCMDVYAANGGERLEYGGADEGMLAIVCSEVRVMARAIYDAGDNPTRNDIGNAIAGLGPVDGNHMIPMSFGLGKYGASDATQTGAWTFPCQIEGGAFDENDTCIVNNSDYELVDP